MKTNKILLALLLGMLLLTACQPEATAQPEISASTSEGGATASPATEAAASQSQNSILFATLSELTGVVELKQAGQSSFSPASANAKLDVNGQVQTGADGKVRLDLSSGTIIRVAPSSLFTLTSNEETEAGLWTKITMEIGKVFIILNGGSVEVQTPAGVAAVQGSYLKVEFDKETGELTLTCLEGSCSVVAPNGETKKFTDGQKIVIRKDPQTGGWIVDEELMSPEDFQEWLDNNPEAKELVEQALGGGTESCFSIIQPGTGANLPYRGKVKFEWGAQPGAAKYLVKFTNSNGKVIVFETTGTSLEQYYIEGFLPDGGKVSWSVTALDETGAEICSTEVATFTKPDSNWKPEKEKEKEEEFYNPYYGW